MKFLRIAATLGSIFKMFGLLLLLPAFGAVYWDDDGVPASSFAADLGLPMKVTTASFLITAIFTMLLGFVLAGFGQEVKDELREREAFFIVGAGWLFCALLGSLPFLLTGATRDVTVAVFEAMSGITTTGFTALPGPLESYPPSVHVWRGTLNFFGGLGMIVVAVAVVARLTEGGVKLMSMESAGGDVTRLRPKLSQTAKAIFGVYLGLNIVFFVAFWIILRYTGSEGLGWRDAGFHALVHAMGTMATGGFSTRSLSAAAFGSSAFNIAMFIGLFLGGTQFALLYTGLSRGLASFWQNSEFRFYVAVMSLSGLATAGFLAADGRELGFSLGVGVFTALSTMTTAGFTIGDVDAFPDGAKLVLLFLMFTGAMVGSTAGGIKLARILLLLKLTYRELAKLLHPHAVSVVKVGRRIFPEETMRRIVVFFFVYVTIFIAGALSFALLGLDFETSLVASAATLGNVGFGWAGVADGFMDPLGLSSPLARLVGALLMWLGRLEIFTVLLLFVPATYRD